MHHYSLYRSSIIALSPCMRSHIVIHKYYSHYYTKHCSCLRRQQLYTVVTRSTLQILSYSICRWRLLTVSGPYLPLSWFTRTFCFGGTSTLAVISSFSDHVSDVEECHCAEKLTDIFKCPREIGPAPKFFCISIAKEVV